MKIWNTTTNEFETLIYAPTGCDCLGELTADDDCIRYNADEDRYEADGAAIEFWREWIEEAEEADALEEELADKLGDKMAASEVSIEAASSVEFNDGPRARIAALKEALAE